MAIDSAAPDQGVEKIRAGALVQPQGAFDLFSRKRAGTKFRKGAELHRTEKSSE
ncbi:MAG: hypothetical protein ACXVB9_17475 [Bdellovibrionota bacterium]